MSAPTTPPVIDLGLFHFDPEADPDQGPGSQGSWSAWARRVRLARWLPAALAVVVVSPLSAAAAPAPPPLDLLWTAQDSVEFSGGMALGDRSVYVATYGEGGGDLTSYRLGDGQVEWQAPLAGAAGEYYTTTVADSVPIVTSQEPAHTTAYDPETGALLWSRDGHPFRQGEEPLWIVDERNQPSDRAAGDAGIEFATVDPWTGRATGSVLLDEEETTFGVWESADGAAWLVALRRNGQLTRYHPGTGEVAATTATEYEDRRGSQQTVEAVGDLVVVVDDTGVESHLTAYDADTLEPEWTVDDGRWVMPCGPVVCVGGLLPDVPGTLTETVRGIDPATGVSRWSQRCEPGDPTAQRAWCGVSAQLLEHPDRVWLVQAKMTLISDDEGTTEMLDRFWWAADAGTGQRLTETTDWEPYWPTGPGEMLVAHRTGGPDPARDPTHTWLGILDVDLGTVQVLGTTGAGGCFPFEPYLVCVHQDEPAEVWRVNR